MNISNKLNLTVSQKKTIHQTFVQSLNILSLTTMQLKEKIYEKLNENPFLEEVEKGTNEKIIYKENSDNWIDSIPYDFNLIDSLKLQILELSLSKEEKEIAYILLSELERNGLFTQKITEISKKYHFSDTKIHFVLSELKNLEPIGVFSENIQECVLKKILFFFPKNEDLFYLVKNFWEEIQKLDYKKIKQKTNWEKSFTIYLINLLKKIYPYPITTSLDKKNELYIFPDIEIKKIYNEWKIIIENDFLPTLEVKIPNLSYEKSEKEYFQKKIQEAKSFIYSLKKRNQTLYQFTNALLNLQEDFFNKGNDFLKPLTLEEIADFSSFHKSTISRLVQNKSIKTDFGIFPLKYFFSSSLRKIDNTNISSHLIKQKIKYLISQENSKKPLSDMKISELLFKDEIIVSKRLVNKYRNQIGILPYNKRKVFNFANKEN